MGTPCVSVVLPVFNNAAHLPALLDSLRSQTERSFEVVAVDDGSSDASFSILQDAARRDRRLVVLRQENKGVSAARNRALGHARGRWIAFADSDDWLSPGTLQAWREHAEGAELDLVIGNGFTFAHRPDETPGPRRALLAAQPWGEVVSGRRWIKLAVAKREWPHYVWLQLVRRDLLRERHAHFAEAMVNHSDIVWTLSLALASRRVGFHAAPLYGYRLNPASLTHNASNDAVYDRARSYLLVLRQLLAEAKRLEEDRALHEALIRHVGFEGRNFVNLIRKRLADPDARRALAREYLSLGVPRTLFAGAASGREYWHALRYWLFAHGCAACRAGDGAALPASGPPRPPASPGR